MTSFLFRAVLAAVLALGAVGATASGTDTVTTSTYEWGNRSEDIDISCRWLDFASSTEPDRLSGQCNAAADGNSDIGNPTGIDLRHYITCTEDANGNWAPKWYTPSTWDGTLVDWDVGTSSTGTDYEIEVRCKPTGNSVTQTLTTMTLSAGIKNNLGSFGKNF